MGFFTVYIIVTTAGLVVVGMVFVVLALTGQI
jgi:hypothetical protein